MRKFPFLFILLTIMLLNDNYCQNENIDYNFPIIPGTMEWRSMGKRSELVHELQIPENVLSLLPTDRLLRICLDYPYLNDIWAYYNVKDGFNSIMKEFNGFRELFKRKDCNKKLISLYLDRNVELNGKWSDVECAQYFLNYIHLELMITHPDVLGNFDLNQLAVLLESTVKRYETVKDLKGFSPLNEFSITYLLSRILYFIDKYDNHTIPRKWNDFLENPNFANLFVAKEIFSDSAEFLNNSKKGGNLKYRIINEDYVYTPRGTPVSAGIGYGEYSQGTIDALNAYVLSVYNNVEIVGDASATYNCFGYAWHMTEGGENAWVDDQTAYMADGSYDLLPSETNATKVKYQYTHAAITTDTEGIHISKWGELSLVRHASDNTPDYGSPVGYYRRSVDVPEDCATVEAALLAAVPGQTIEISSGNYCIFNSISIGSGVIVNIHLGVTVSFTSGVGLTINGTLNATNATFTGETPATYWDGIYYASGSSGIINGCTINNVQAAGGAAIVINNSNPTIKYSTVSSSSCSGIQILSNAYPYIHHCTINGGYHGIYINHASGYIQYNTISSSTGGGSAAVYCYNYANPLFGTTWDTYDGHNILQSCFMGIYASYSSNVNAGISDMGRWNRFLNAISYNAYATGNSTIYARNNYWEPSLPSNKVDWASGSYVYTDPTWNGQEAGLNVLHKPDNISAVNSSNKDLLLQAKELRGSKNYVQAVLIYKNLIETQSETSDAEIAVVELSNTYKESNDNNIINYLDNFALSNDKSNNLTPIINEVLAGIFHSEGLRNQAEAIDQKLISDYPNTIHEKNGLMNLFFSYYNDSDLIKAKEMLSLVKEEFKDKDEFNAAVWLLELAGEPFSTYQPENNNKETTLNEEILFGNYPNPFNPSTIIKYQLPETGLVKITIYDILGKEISTIVNETQEAGLHEVGFNAEHLPSGVYIYTITANGFMQAKKMILAK